MRTFTACFRSQRPLQTCGPELKTKLYDPFEPFSASYHVQVAKRVSEVIFINSFISDAQSSTTFALGVLIFMVMIHHSIYNFIPARRPLAAGDAGLETGYPEKICHHDVRRTYDGQKITPLIVGAQFSFWSFFIDFELMSNFFVVQEKDSRQIVCFSGWSLISRDSEISSFESYTLLRLIENENQLDVGIQFLFAWFDFCAQKE